MLCNRDAPRTQRLRYTLHAALAGWTFTSGLLLMVLIQTCGHCPSEPFGECTARVGTVAAGVFTVIMYYELRVIFRRNPRVD